MSKVELTLEEYESLKNREEVLDLEASVDKLKEENYDLRNSFEKLKSDIFSSDKVLCIDEYKIQANGKMYYKDSKFFNYTFDVKDLQEKLRRSTAYTNELTSRGPLGRLFNKNWRW